MQMSVSLNNLTPTADCATTGSPLPGSGGWSLTPGPNGDGVGDILTQPGTGSSITIDTTVTLSVGTIILVKDETTLKNNGLYICTTAGASGVPCVLTRHNNMNTSIQFNYSIVAVSRGTTNANTLWMFQYVSGFVIDGLTSSSYVQFASLGVAGMNKTIQQLPIVSGAVQWDVSKGYNAYYNPAAGSSYAIAFKNLPTTNIGVFGTLVVTQPASGAAGVLIVPQSSPPSIIVGGGTPSSMTTGQILLSTANNAVDILSFYYDGSYAYWTYAPNFKP
jgi:hypothetical protein